MTPEGSGISAAFGAASRASGKSSAQKRRAAPFSLRFTADERARVERDAAGQSLGAFIKSRLFGEDAHPTRSRGKFPVRDHKLLGELLGKLGSTRLANNLNQLARLAHLGTLPVTPELSDELRQACAEIAIMKAILMDALGIKER
jgi:hypothetical protein